MTRLILALELASFAFLAMPSVPPSNQYPLTKFEVYDGDTLEHADIRLGFGVGLDDQRVRLAEFDAYEITLNRRGVVYASDEVRRGIKARDALARLTKEADRCWLEPTKQERDNFGRIFARLYVERDGKTVDVAEWMRKNGHERQ